MVPLHVQHSIKLCFSTSQLKWKNTPMEENCVNTCTNKKKFSQNFLIESVHFFNQAIVRYHRTAPQLPCVIVQILFSTKT